MGTTDWRVEVRLKPGGRELLRSHMQVRGLSNRELAELCGSTRYRASISHLAGGGRDGCSAELAAKLNKVLLGDAVKKGASLFEPRVYRVARDSETVQRGRAA